MSFVLAVSVGPVQEFIASARRTRDLYAGSRLLSEAAAKAAEFVAGRVGPEFLVFPAPDSNCPLDELVKAGIPNVILALVPDGEDPARLGEGALAAARRYLKEKAREVLAGSGFRQTYVDVGAALAQVQDLLEGYFACVPLAHEGTYRQAREQVMALLSARKNTRDFGPVSWGSAAFKSSLDGARESVLRLPDDPAVADAVRIRLGLRRGEYLSGPDLLKRWWPAGEGFVSTTHMAAMPFWHGVRARGAEEAVRKALEDLARLAGQEARADTWHPVLSDTPFAHYDVRLLYEGRLEEFSSLSADPEKLEKARKRLRVLWGEVRSYGVPAPPGTYYALLRADGDRMGEVLDRLETPDAHRRFSNALALGFARRAKQIVEAGAGGLVYCGGDDVLALLPLHTALDTAWALAREFQQAVGPYVRGGSQPTLSVGLAVVHHLEPLQDALELARRAERLAKDGLEGEEKRNALAVAYSPRSGAELAVRGRHDEKPGLGERLRRYADLLRLGLLPSRAAFELVELVREAGSVLSDEALVAEAVRILGRKEMKREYRDQLAGWLRTARDVERLALELVLARPFAEAFDQAGVPEQTAEVRDAR